MLKFGLVTLGCDKNTVDSERYLADLVAHGGEQVTDLRWADVVVVSTCGFIDVAKAKSIEAIVAAARLKDDGECQAVFAIGCMVERHKLELQEALPEHGGCVVPAIPRAILRLESIGGYIRFKPSTAR